MKNWRDSFFTCLLVLPLVFCLIGQVSAETITYYHHDLLHTPLAVTDASGNVIWWAKFYPYGSKYTGNSADTDPQRFTGKEYEEELGLYYFGARYYKPTISRFLSVDPKGGSERAPQRWNRYSYGNNNPYRYLDSSGEWPTEAHNTIIYRAFPKLPRNLRNALQKGSANVDEDQSTEGAYKHAMLAPKQSVQDAQEKLSHFIQSKVDQFKQLIGEGNTEAAYVVLGEALHPIEDSTSPSHKGYQVWEGVDSPDRLRKYNKAMEHWLGEQNLKQSDIEDTTRLINKFINSNQFINDQIKKDSTYKKTTSSGPE